jgi:hypothetical protein
MGQREAREAARKAEADAVLKRVVREADTVGGSALARSANQVRDHFAAKDAPEDDRIEVWGRRIGRGIAAVAVVVLLIMLVNTYGLN